MLSREESKRYWNTVCAGLGVHDWQSACRPFWQIIAQHADEVDGLVEHSNRINAEWEELNLNWDV